MTMRQCTKLVSLCLGLAVTTGCWKSQGAEVLFSAAPEYAHYVVIDRGASSVRVLDCISMPDGETWDPQCIRVDRPVNQPPEGERTQPPLPNYNECEATP